MIKRDLKDNFQISISGQDTWYGMSVPGSAMDTFCKEGILPDPYYGMNEYKWTEFWKNDFDIRSTFSVSAEEIASEEILLTFYGIDTVADVFLNGKKLGHTENMHRTWVYQVKELVKEGENLLELHIASPVKFIEAYKPEKGREIHLTNTGTTPGSQYIRKAHSMFGWDWGPKLPDAGLFRGVELCCFDNARLGESLIRQEHVDGAVTLHIGSEIEKADGQVVKTGNTAMQSNENSAKNIAAEVKENTVESVDRQVRKNAAEISAAQPGISGLQLFYELRDPSGALLYTGTNSDIKVTNPALWWPNGYGKQPLYTLTIQLKAGETVLDTREYCIGLRTVTVSHEDDQWGQEFAIMVNGVKIFARGADYIPDDCFYPRITREILERDVKACVFANFNCLRVWGGGYYPSDEFYDLCDEYGILLWEDLMYACNIYDVTPDFAENIAIEAKDNILRFRNHACLGLICGNNELECAWTDWKDAQGHAPSLKRDYLYQFEFLLADVVKENAPDAFYWPSSPSSGGSFDNPCDENRGDCHYWDVWHGQKPFSEYMKHYFRFCSEFGFQSLPSIKTVETFTGEKDRNLFSRVMESHQKNPAANGKILYYLSETFRYPKDLESLIFLSQILQGYAMKEATEHWRRNRGRCMGSIYWQFNDNWPVASWSSMDYYGRYKALHYMAKGFCDNVAGSIEKKETHMGFWISNETLAPVTVKAKIAVKTLDFQVIEEQEVSKEVPALSAECLFEKEYKELIAGRDDSVFFVAEYEYEQNGQKVSKKEFETFVPVKYLELKDPAFKVTENADGSVSIQTDTFVPYCMLEGISADTIWNENVVAFTDKEAVTLVPVENQKISRDGVRIYDIYHTYH